MMEVSKQWPEDQETPSFGKTTSESSNLSKFIERLGNDEQFTFKKYGLGQKAIKEMVLTHMRERRRAQKVAKICESESESADTAGTISASESSSSNGSPPPVSTTKRGNNMWRILTQVSTRTLHNICLGKCSALDFNS